MDVVNRVFRTVVNYVVENTFFGLDRPAVTAGGRESYTRYGSTVASLLLSGGGYYQNFHLRSTAINDRFRLFCNCQGYCGTQTRVTFSDTYTCYYTGPLCLYSYISRSKTRSSNGLYSPKRVSHWLSPLKNVSSSFLNFSRASRKSSIS